MKSENTENYVKDIYKTQEELNNALDALHIADKDVPDYSQYEELPFDEYCKVTGYRTLEEIVDEVGCERGERVEFDFSEWDSRRIRDSVELKAKLEEMKLEGRTISDIRFISHVYETTEDELIEHLHYVRERYYGHDLDKYFDLVDLDDTFPYPLYIEMDEPVLIRFDDGDQFEIETCYWNSCIVSMNSIPWDADGTICDENINPSILLDFCIGGKIEEISVTEKDREDDENIESVIIKLSNDGQIYNLVFEIDDDFVLLTVENGDRFVIHCPIKKLLQSMYKRK